jgi:ribosome-associated toxin RatA of RatAB toxin-antitoxin module
MRLGVRSSMKPYLEVWIFLCYTGIFFSPGFALCSTQVDLDHKLAAGEIIVSTEEVPGKSLKCAEMVGVVDAPPEIVWQVLTDVNNFKNFMPRTRNSMAVAPEKIPVILQKKTTRAEEVEQLLGPIPADPASYRIPGGIYTVYFYSNLDLPWPCNNRWYIIKGVRDETRAAQHCYHSSWSLVTGNLRENSGEWILEPFGSSKTKAIYRLCTDPGGAIPKFLVTQGTCTTMPQIIKAVRKRAANLLGQKQP